MEKAVIYTLKLLYWLRRNVGSLKVCGNPECDTGKRYFLRVHSNDKYCCVQCAQTAKELRQQQRDIELNKPPKEFKRSAEARHRMSVSARRRWERERAKKGRPK
jgi:hypothetical protein